MERIGEWRVTVGMGADEALYKEGLSWHCQFPVEEGAGASQVLHSRVSVLRAQGDPS